MDYTIWDTILGVVCIAPWICLIWIALADKQPKQKQKPYREIPMRDERAGFVQAKLEKIERASR